MLSPMCVGRSHRPRHTHHGDNHEQASTTPVPATPEQSTTEAPPTPSGSRRSRGKHKKRLRDILQHLNVYSQNTQGGIEEAKFEYIVGLVEKKKIDAHCVQETWIQHDFQKEINSMLIFHHGMEKENERGRPTGGVAIFLSKKARRAWERAGYPEPTKSGRLAGCARHVAVPLTFEDHLGEKVKTAICSACHPTGVTAQDQTLFMDNLTSLYESFNDNVFVMSGNDVNASLGNSNSIHARRDGSAGSYDTQVTGPFGNPRTNDKGIELTNLLFNKNLAAATTFFKQKRHNTWTSNLIDAGQPDSEFQLDHFIASRKDLKSVDNARRVGDGAPSDHAAMQLKAHLATKMTKRKKRNNHQEEKKKRKVRIDWSKTQERETKEKLNQATKRKLKEKKEEEEEEEEEPTNSQQHTTFSRAIIEAAEETMPADKKKDNDWCRQSKVALDKAIEKRNRAHDRWTADNSTENREAHREERRAAKEEIRKAKEKWQEKKATEVHQMRYDPKNAWKAVRELQEGISQHHVKPTIMKMRKENGELARTDEENAEVMGPHFGRVCNNRRPTQAGIAQEIDPHEVEEVMATPPNIEEINAAIEKLKNGKSAGENGLTPKALKALDGELRNTLTKIIADFWENEETDYEEWHRNILCALPKKGDLSDPNKWRGTCLADLANKVVSSIMSTRLLKHLEKVGIETQHGSTPNRGCADALFSLKSALQIRKQHGLDTWAAFIDLVKAFDTADHELLFEILARYGVPDKLINVIRRMCKDTKVILRIGEILKEI